MQKRIFPENEGANPTGSYRPNAISTDQPQFYNQTTQHLIPVDPDPWAQQVFENSPLQRLLKSGMVGNGFQPVGGTGPQRFKTVNYRPNNTTMDGNILVWNPDGTFTSGNYYAVNTLSVTDGTDEDGLETLAYTDLTGHPILKRQLLSSGNLDTYYIYNNAGMIAYIVPPKATAALAPGSNINVAPLSNLVFKFVYDDHGRLIEKTAPAKGVMYIVYDPLNRPILLQDANMHANNQWNYIKYDTKRRAISQGIYFDGTHTSLLSMQNFVNTAVSFTIWYEQRTNAGTTTGYYTNLAFPTTDITPLAYAYFDDYNMTESSGPDFNYMPTGLGEAGATTAFVKGMPTMTTKTVIGPGIASTTWLTTVIFYDKQLHPIQNQSNNQLNYTNATTVTDTKTTIPDFIGVPQISIVKKITGTTTSVQTNFTYDQMDRVTSISQKYNAGPTIVTAAYTYNEAGQVVAKNLGQAAPAAVPANLTLNDTQSSVTVAASNSITASSATPNFKVLSGTTFKAFISSATGYLQTVDYRYNIRGQLLNINNSKLSNDNGVTNNDSNDLFGMTFFYDQPGPGLGNHVMYDGKLTGVEWMSKSAKNISSYERAFNYCYDGVNRDTAAIYNERPTASTGSFTKTDGWDENRITYDQNGNLLTLFRMEATQGAGNHVPIDNLTYTYSTTNPNQLNTVTDGTGGSYNTAGFMVYPTGNASGNYTYDPNGNLKFDPYKNLTFDNYNVLNKTSKITLSTGNYTDYTYDTGGNLVRKRQYVSGALTTTTDYIDGFVYVNTTLSYFPMPEGRVVNNAGTLVQEFVITDQQGNARISFWNNGSNNAIVRQENSYYAFGLIMPGSTVGTPATPNKQLYNGGSEWQNDFSNLPDYYQTFNRNYDAAIGRFVGVDPQAESAESMTTYQYSGNNPIMYNDPVGDLAGAVVNGIFQQYNGSNDFQDWQNTSGPGGGAGGSGYGLYYTNPSAYWDYYKSTNGTLGGKSAYQAADSEGPASGMSLAKLGDLLNSFLNGYGIKATTNGLYYTSLTYLGSTANTTPLTQSDNSPVQFNYKVNWNFISFGDMGSAAWNSPEARYLVPDIIALNYNVTLVAGIGGSGQTSLNLITRGKDAGIWWTYNYTGRFGLQADAGFTGSAGWYTGDPQDATLSSFLNDGVDVSGAYGFSIGLWGSIDPNGNAPNWVGYSMGGEGLGFSFGGGQTKLITGFRFQ